MLSYPNCRLEDFLQEVEPSPRGQKSRSQADISSGFGITPDEAVDGPSKRPFWSAPISGFWPLGFKALGFRALGFRVWGSRV